MLQLPLTSLGNAWADSHYVQFNAAPASGPLGHADQLYLEQGGWQSQHAAKSERAAHLGTRQPGNDLAQFGIGIATESGVQGVVHLKCHLSLK